jgi:hypothetical protein
MPSGSHNLKSSKKESHLYIMGESLVYIMASGSSKPSPSGLEKRKCNPLCDEEEGATGAMVNEVDIYTDDKTDLETGGEIASEESSSEQSESESESDTNGESVDG